MQKGLYVFLLYLGLLLRQIVLFDIHAIGLCGVVSRVGYLGTLCVLLFFGLPVLCARRDGYSTHEGEKAGRKLEPEVLNELTALFALRYC